MPDAAILIQNEKPKSPRRISVIPNVFCCKFVVNIIAQTAQECKTKEKYYKNKIISFINIIQHTA